MLPREILAKTLDDHRLSRAERQALGDLIGDDADDPRALDNWRQAAFEVARRALANPEDAELMNWLENVVRALRPREDGPAAGGPAEAYFSPGDDCPRAITRKIDQARASIDVCVFTITDDRLADALIAAKRRGVALRIITDNEKASDLGSDIERLGKSGVPLRVDRSPFHMHHKFAIFDRAWLLTGSYNWTRGAARDNAENLIITPDRGLLKAFQAQFDQIWKALS